MGRFMGRDGKEKGWRTELALVYPELNERKWRWRVESNESAQVSDFESESTHLAPSLEMWHKKKCRLLCSTCRVQTGQV